MDKAAKTAAKLSKDMQKGAASLQKAFGNVGDAAASNLMQAAKVSAGKLIHSAEDVEALEKELKDLSSKTKGIKNFKDASEVTQAERLMEAIEASVAKSSGALEKLQNRIDLASPSP